jgi:hypothetical protein
MYACSVNKKICCTTKNKTTNPICAKALHKILKIFSLAFVRLLLSDVCYLRLDFETFNTLAPTVTTELAPSTCPDTFKVTVSTFKAEFLMMLIF